MDLVERNLGLSTADGEEVRLRFERGDMILSFVDWCEQSQETTFRDVLAFRWQDLDEEGIRDDTTYEVVGSSWLTRQAQLQAVPVAEYAHYKLCFNACGVLDILCRKRSDETSPNPNE